MEGSIVEHSQNRQRKLDSGKARYFLRVAELLPFVLQYSLLTFTLGILRYLLETNKAAVYTTVIAALCALLFFASACVVEAFYGSRISQTSAPVCPLSLLQRVRDTFHPRTALELQSISWILRTSLDEAVRLSALKYLMSIPELPKFDPTLVAGCFHVLIGCIDLTNDKVMIRQGSEQLATMSAGCFFRTFHRLSVTNPALGILKGLRQCYDVVFPPDADFRGLPFHHTMKMIHTSIKNRLSPGPVEWDKDGLSIQERIPLAWYMAKAAQVEYRESKGKKVPRWILRFALDSLPLNPPPPPSVVADCLEIAAVDLDCDVSNITTMEEGCVRTRWISTSLTQN